MISWVPPYQGIQKGSTCRPASKVLYICQGQRTPDDCCSTFAGGFVSCPYYVASWKPLDYCNEWTGMAGSSFLPMTVAFITWVHLLCFACLALPCLASVPNRTEPNRNE